MNQSFLIIHGLGGSGSDHWQTWLSNELTKKNFNVYYPTFSNNQSPNLNVWLKELDTIMKKIPKNQPLTVITHSLGNFLWLHYAARQNKRIAQKAILVAPPSPSAIIPQASSFYPVPLNKMALLNAAEETLFVHSSNDPYCQMKDAEQFTRLGLPRVVFPNMGHINAKSGHGPWPWILKKCLSNERVKLTS